MKWHPHRLGMWGGGNSGYYIISKRTDVYESNFKITFLLPPASQIRSLFYQQRVVLLKSLVQCYKLNANLYIHQSHPNLDKSGQGFHIPAKCFPEGAQHRGEHRTGNTTCKFGL